jgi:hypothetical protein
MVGLCDELMDKRDEAAAGLEFAEQFAEPQRLREEDIQRRGAERERFWQRYRRARDAFRRQYPGERIPPAVDPRMAKLMEELNP